MRSFILPLICLVAVSLSASAQTESATGSIEIPSMVSIDLDQVINNQDLRFDTWNYFTNGRGIPSAFNMHVQSNVPWAVSVMADNLYFTPVSADASPDMPVSLINVKKSTSANYVPLTNTPQPFIQSQNSNIDNTYSVDLMMNGPWNYKGGRYTANIIFSITPQ